MTSSYIGIYDFSLLPYALGDVLTWNVQSAVAAKKAGRSRVDVHICLDPRYPASIYQRGLINDHNCGLFFNELFGAFSTHPMLGEITIHNERERMMACLRALGKDDALVAGITDEYAHVLANPSDEAALNAYFIRQIYSHEVLNDFAASAGGLPLLHASAGCLPDIEALRRTALAGRKIVVIHPRLRRLDHGYGGEHTFSRDSDLLEWMAFVQSAHAKHPEVQFVVVGRLQEKPLALLEQPNVMSLRSLGLGLGHELTLLRGADLFIGTSSGFAAMANFCTTPYFITKMNPESCKAYAIANGAKALPFAQANQELVYETETASMLMGLLERGLAESPAASGQAPARSASLDPQDYEAARQQYVAPNATTVRYFADATAIDAESVYLLWPKMRAGFVKLAAGEATEAKQLGQRIARYFPRLHARSELVKRLASGQVDQRFFPYASQRWKEFVLGLNANSLPSILRHELVLIPARLLKTAFVKRPTR